MVHGPGAVLGDPLQVVPLAILHTAAVLGQLLLGEQARLDPLGQLDLLLGVEQRHLADLLQVVLDRVRGGARHRDLRGRKIIIVVTEDEDLLVLAGAVRGQPGHAGTRHAGAHGLGVRGRLARLGVLGVPGSVRYFRPAGVAGQIAGHLVGIAEAGLDQVPLGQYGLQVGVVGVEIAEVAGIRVLQIRVSTGTRLAGVHRDQAAAGGGAQLRTVVIRVPGTRTVWPRSRLNRLILNGPSPLVRGPGAVPLALGHLPAVTLRAAPGFAVPGITPAHPPRLFDHQPRHRHSQPRARPSPGPGHPRCVHDAGGSGEAELAGPGVHAGLEPFVVHLRVAIGRDLAGRPFRARAWSMSVTAAGSARTAPASGGTQAGLSALTFGVSPRQSPPG